jgi:hypothetical protein
MSYFMTGSCAYEPFDSIRHLLLSREAATVRKWIDIDLAEWRLKAQREEEKTRGEEMPPSMLPQSRAKVFGGNPSN